MTFLVRVFLIITMFSAAARAFLLTSARPNASRLPYVVARGMSSSGGADTSIVDVCKQKIVDALETEKVEVTGNVVACRSFCM
jgi:hypothetical protein